MKKITFLFISLISIYSFSQIRKEVENGIYVTFPNVPKYEVVENNSSYLAETNNCLFMVITQRNIIPNYDKYLEAQKKWTESEKQKIINILLDNAVQGQLDYTGNTGKSENIKIGQFFGRKVTYSAINPTNGERTQRVSIILSVRDRLLNFNVFYMQKTPDNVSKKEMEDFINSISTIK